jgi:hypothetical protein
MALLRHGPYCCAEHKQELLDRHRRLAELRAEDVWAMPPAFTLADFHRQMLKFAVHLIELMTAEEKQHCRQKADWMLDPLEFALDLKARVLELLPAEYVRIQSAVGAEQLFRDGSFTFLKPVPALLVIQALRQVGQLPIDC